MKIIINSSGKQKNSFDVAIAASCLCALVQLYAQPHGNSAMVSLSVRFLQLIWIIAGGKVLLLRLRIRQALRVQEQKTQNNLITE